MEGAGRAAGRRTDIGGADRWGKRVPVLLDAVRPDRPSRDRSLVRHQRGGGPGAPHRRPVSVLATAAAALHTPGPATVDGWEGEVVQVEPSGSLAFRVSSYVPA